MIIGKIRADREAVIELEIVGLSRTGKRGVNDAFL